MSDDVDEVLAHYAAHREVIAAAKAWFADDCTLTEDRLYAAVKHLIALGDLT